MRDPVLFFSPASALEAAEIFRACGAAAERGRKIRAGVVESPFRPADGVALPGANSSLEKIESLRGAGEALVFLSHASMREVHEISKKDFLAVAGGGVKFGALVDEARKAGLYFPHEPDILTREATVAEIIMDGTIFSTEGRYGRLREHVLSLELVTPGGEIIRTGSRSVKDVTGYDIAAFLMGGGGLCGMIAKATLRLLPSPGTRVSFTCAGGRGALEALAGEIHRKLAPAFLELFPDGMGSPGGARLIGELQSAVRGREEALLVNLSGLAPEDVRVSRLEPADLEEYRRSPLSALEEGRRLCHVSSSVELGPRPFGDSLHFVSLFPTRFHYYLNVMSESEESGMLAAAGPGSRVETIEMRDGRMLRKRLRGRDGEDELARRVHSAFDPRGLMLP